MGPLEADLAQELRYERGQRRVPGGVPGAGTADAPKPGRSRAMTSYAADNAGSTGSHICHRLPIPWMSTNGAPLPAR